MSRLKLSLNELANANLVPNRAPSGSGPPYTGCRVISPYTARASIWIVQRTGIWSILGLQIMVPYRKSPSMWPRVMRS